MATTAIRIAAASLKPRLKIANALDEISASNGVLTCRLRNSELSLPGSLDSPPDPTTEERVTPVLAAVFLLDTFLRDVAFLREPVLRELCAALLANAISSCSYSCRRA